MQRMLRGAAAAARILLLAIGVLQISEPAFAQQRLIRIMALGDSYSSGEGAPDGYDAPSVVDAANCSPTRVDQPARWDANAGLRSDRVARITDTACHRAARSWPILAADRLRAQVPESVSLTSLACSGAEIPDLVERPYRGLGEDPGTCLTDESGRQIAFGALCDLERHVRRTEEERLARESPGTAYGGIMLDGVVMTIGGNDVGFGPTVQHCLFTPLLTGCQHMPTLIPGASTDVDAGAEELDRRYRRLADAIERVNRRYVALFRRPLIANVFLAEYPSPMTYDDGSVCGGPSRPTFDLFDRVSREEARWANDVVVPRLNQKAADGARMIQDEGGGAYGFFVKGVAARFKGHGFCATDRWINLVKDSIRDQGDCTGAAHPNARGQIEMAEIVAPALQVLRPPAVPVWSLNVNGPDPATVHNAQGLRLAWKVFDSRAAFVQIAHRAVSPADAAGPAVSPPMVTPDSLGTPPRLPHRDHAERWQIDRAGNLLTSTVSSPDRATDYALRTCTPAMCSHWSGPLRVTSVAEQQAVRTARPSVAVQVVNRDNLFTQRLRARWSGETRANGFHQVSYVLSTGGTQQTFDVPAGRGEHELSGARSGTWNVKLRECVRALVSGGEFVGRICSRWSDVVAATIERPMRRETPERARRATDPARLRPNLPTR